MAVAAVSPQQLSYMMLALLGSPYMGNTDKVELQVKSDNLDGTVTVPKWVLAQAAGSTFGYVPEYYYDNDETMPASTRMDADEFEIHVDLSAYDLEANHVKVKVLDSENIRVEAKKRYINRYGAATSTTVSRKFRVPKTYDTNRLSAHLNYAGTLNIVIPRKNSVTVESTSVLRNSDDKYVVLVDL